MRPAESFANAMTSVGSIGFRAFDAASVGGVAGAGLFAALKSGPVPAAATPPARSIVIRIVFMVELRGIRRAGTLRALLGSMAVRLRKPPPEDVPGAEGFL